MNKNEYNNWYNFTKEIANKYKINIAETNLQQTSKNEWKEKMKKAVSSHMKKNIIEKSKAMTKLRIIRKQNFGMKDYVIKMNEIEVKDVIKLRTNMKEVKENFRNNQDNNDKCPLCESAKDTTEHLFECDKTKNLRSIDDVKMDVLYETKDIEIMKKALGYLDEAFKLRKLKSDI